MEAVESMDAWVWLSLTIVNRVSFLANMYTEDNKFYSILFYYYHKQHWCILLFLFLYMNIYFIMKYYIDAIITLILTLDF